MQGLERVIYILSVRRPQPLNRVSCLILNPIPKLAHFLDYLNFWASLIFSFGQFVRTCAT